MANEPNNQLIQPEDLSRTFENAMHVFKHGNHDKLPELLQDTGHLLMKASKKLSPVQLVLAVAAAAVVANYVVSRIEEGFDDHSVAA